MIGCDVNPQSKCNQDSGFDALGTQFDPTFARIMLRLMDEEERISSAS
ncbi:MAG: hypothetical protein IK090_02615 [Clostridia bacterium]|nr:hypothetical protein [Clostridia bacterium]